MSFSQAIVSYFANAFNFKSRSIRSEYWYVVLFNTLVKAAFRIVTLYHPELYLLAPIYSLITLIPSLALSIRRLHDIGVSGKVLWLMCLPCVLIFTPLQYLGLATAAIWAASMRCMAMIPSDPSANKYGESKVVSLDVAEIDSAKLAQYKGANSIIGIAYLVIALLLSVGAKGYRLYVTEYKYLLPRMNVWLKIVDDLKKLQSEIVPGILLILPIILTYCVITSRSKDGKRGLALAGTALFFSAADVFKYISDVNTDLITNVNTDLLNYNLYTTAVVVLKFVAFIIMFVLCYKYSQGTLHLTKLTTVLCFSQLIFTTLTTVVVDTLTNGFSTDYIIVINKLDNPFYFLNIAVPLFCGAALYFRFKYAKCDGTISE